MPAETLIASFQFHPQRWSRGTYIAWDQDIVCYGPVNLRFYERFKCFVFQCLSYMIKSHCSNIHRQQRIRGAVLTNISEDLRKRNCLNRTRMFTKSSHKNEIFKNLRMRQLTNYNTHMCLSCSALTACWSPDTVSFNHHRRVVAQTLLGHMPCSC